MTLASFGSWKSPITSESIVSGSVGLSEVAIDDQDIYWIEARPIERGRRVIVKRTPDGSVSDVNPAPFNARTRVHEYGGAAYAVNQGVVYFVNFADQRLYRTEPGSVPVAISPVADVRFADFRVDRGRNRIVGVREDHRDETREAVNTISAIRTDGTDIETGGTVLSSGRDFYSNPRLSPDGQRLAWLEWDHPNMPWDGTELWVADITADGTLANRVLVAGGLTESIFQPEWSPDGVLHFVSDRTGWWNLYRSRGGGAEAIAPMDAEFGEPLWVFGLSTYGFASSERVICSYTQDGTWNIANLDLRSDKLDRVPTQFSAVGDIAVGNGFVAFIAGSASTPRAVYRHALSTGDTIPLRASSGESVDPGYLSRPESVAFPTEGGNVAYGFFYPPTNKDFAGPAGELPPLVVLSHGGPTSQTDNVLSLQRQYWTSRGFAILDVDYGGSTGYGRAYRERLRDNWGIVDVDDCVNGARYLVERGLVDGNRLAIRGWSASGYTTLAALTFRSTFKAGASHFGISDLTAMARDTHKFESRYLDGLIGPYPARSDIYDARSPINFVDNISCPLILFQGLEDKVVPPNQAQMMYDAVRAKGFPVSLVMFEGEQHGFRQAANIRRSLDGELYFLSRVFGFEPAEAIEPVEIANLPSAR